MGIRKGEGRRSILMFAYIFFVIASLMIVKPVRNALFLTEYGPEKLPFAFMLTAVFAAFIAFNYSRLAGKMPFRLLILSSLTFTIVSLLAIWFLLKHDLRAAWFIYGFYIWVSLFGVIAASQFWLLANYVFNAREAKRLFGFLGAGGIAGAIFGGYLTNYLSHIIGSDNLILLCAGFLIVCIFILERIWKNHLGRHQQIFDTKRRKASVHAKLIEPVKLVLQSKHLTYVAAIIGTGVIVANLADYQFNAIASEQISNEDDLTAFFGFWFSNLSVLSLVIQLFFTRILLRKLGVGNSLFFLPAGIFIGALSIMLAPILWTAIFIKVSDGAFKQSVNKSGLELMMLPVHPTVKNKVKIFIDVFVDNIGTGLSGAILLLMTIFFGFGVREISIVVILLTFIWALLIKLSKKEYLESFRLAVEKRNIDLNDLSFNLNDASVKDVIEKVLNGDNERQIIYLLELMEGVPAEALTIYYDRLIKHPSAEVKAWGLRLSSGNKEFDYTPQAAMLMDHQNPDVRIQAILYISRSSDNPFLTLETLVNTWDVSIKTAAIAAAAKEFNRAPELLGEEEFIHLFNHAFNETDTPSISEKDLNILKITTAEVIGISRIKVLFGILFKLFEDESIEVRIAAIISAGKIQSPEFIPVLIDMLDDRQIRIYARKALSQYGAYIVDNLIEKLNSDELTSRTKLEIVKTLGMIDSVKASDTLVKSIKFDDLELRLEMLKALNKQHARFSELKLDTKKISRYIDEEITYFYKHLIILKSHKDSFAEIDSKHSIEINLQRTKSFKLLEKVINERLDASLIRIFRLLGLIYPQDAIYSAYLGVISEKKELNANAVEFLDNLIDNKLKDGVIPIIDKHSTEEIIDALPSKYKTAISTEKDYLSALLESNDTGLITYALFYIAHTGNSIRVEEVSRMTESSVNIVRETAEYTIDKLDFSN